VVVVVLYLRRLLEIDGDAGGGRLELRRLADGRRRWHFGRRRRRRRRCRHGRQVTVQVLPQRRVETAPKK